MVKSRRLVEDFIFRDEVTTTTNTSNLSLACITLPAHELRYSIDESKLEELTATIKSIGLVEPILVRPLRKGDDEERFEVVAGARRYRAAKKAGLSEVPVVVRELNDEQTLEASIVENLQREDLNALEETEAIVRLIAIRLRIPEQDVPPLLHRIQNEVRERTATNNVIGEDQVEAVQNIFNALGLMEIDSFINNRLPLLNLPDEILDALRQGRIAYTKAQVIARLPESDQRKGLLEEAIVNNLPLSKIKNRIKDLSQQKEAEVEQSVVLLRNQVDTAYKRIRKAKIWDNPTKRKQIEKLLAEMEALLADS